MLTLFLRFLVQTMESTSENIAQDFFRDLAAALQSMTAIHQHFWFDDGNQSGFLAQRRIAGQRVRVCLDAISAGNTLADGGHCAPLGEACAHLGMFREALAQSVQTFGDLLSGVTGQILRARINFDARNYSSISENTGEKTPFPSCWRMVSS